jgi:hypothetical protein
MACIAKNNFFKVVVVVVGDLAVVILCMSHIFAAMSLYMTVEPQNPIRTACLYDGGKIESPLRFWAGK